MGLPRNRFLHALAILAFVLGAMPGDGAAAVAPSEARRPSGEALRADHAQLAGRLAKNPFGKPLHLIAREEPGRLTGDTYAVLERPFAEIGKALADPAQWCEILLLPFNTKHCEAAGGPGSDLRIHFGRNTYTPLAMTHRLDFRFDVAAHTDDYLQVTLTAGGGPYGTRDYRIAFEVVALGDNRSFMHLGYAYGHGSIARLAMQAYLATVGASKVGFSVEGRDDEGKPALVRGMRGVMERNTMRYYLAIEAYLRSLDRPPAERAAKMIDDYFAAVERHPRQLHELERGEYVPMKQKEFQRMRAALSPVRRTASLSP